MKMKSGTNRDRAITYKMGHSLQSRPREIQSTLSGERNAQKVIYRFYAKNPDLILYRDSVFQNS